MKQIRVEVLSTDLDTVTVGIPNEYGGETPLVLGPSQVPPQFRPDPGEYVLLEVVDGVPRVVAEVIAADAITAREIRAGSIEAEHITGDAIDGRVITGATLRTAATGERFVVNELGTNPNEIRLYAATGAEYGAFKVTTFNGLPVASLAGFKPAGSAGQLDLRSDAATLFYGSDFTNSVTVIAVSPGVAQVAVDATRRVRVRTADLDVAHPTQVNVITPLVAFTGGPGFNGVTPIARRTVPAAATDAATTQTLANALRTLLIDLGLAI